MCVCVWLPQKETTGATGHLVAERDDTEEPPIKRIKTDERIISTEVGVNRECGAGLKSDSDPRTPTGYQGDAEVCVESLQGVEKKCGAGRKSDCQGDDESSVTSLQEGVEIECAASIVRVKSDGDPQILTDDGGCVESLGVEKECGADPQTRITSQGDVKGVEEQGVGKVVECFIKHCCIKLCIQLLML